MPDFWLDSDVLISAKNGLLAFDIAPRFWAALDCHFEAVRISSPVMVYEELTSNYHQDELADWARARRATHFTDANEQTQEQFTHIADYVVSAYEPAFAEAFLDCADPWLIAYAVCLGGVVVTGEAFGNLPNPNRRTGLIGARVKIPNVCARFNVQVVSLAGMLRALGVTDL